MFQRQEYEPESERSEYRAEDLQEGNDTGVNSGNSESLPDEISNWPIQHVVRIPQIHRISRLDGGGLHQSVDVVIPGEQRQIETKTQGHHQ
jgi:hypothetical protein